MSVPTPKQAPHTIHGKRFEQRFNAAFSALYQTYPIRWERVLDSAGAGNMIRSADSDFNLTINSGLVGRPWRFAFEAKASIRHNSLSENVKGLIKPGQNARLRILERAGVIGCFVFHSVENGDIEFWGTSSIQAHFEKRRAHFTGAPAYVVKVKNLDEMALRIVRDPQWFVNLMTWKPEE